MSENGLAGLYGNAFVTEEVPKSSFPDGWDGRSRTRCG